MNDDNPILYYAPRTRASSVLTLLEELDVPYELRVLNFQLGEQRKPEYLAVNPLGKVPAIVHMARSDGTWRDFHLSCRRLSTERSRARDWRRLTRALSALARVLRVGVRACDRRSFDETRAGARKQKSLRGF